MITFPLAIFTPSASAAEILTTCISLKNGRPYLLQDGKCNPRLYEVRKWYRPGKAPESTPGSELISINLCTNKTINTQIIASKCHPTRQVATTWQRPLGPPGAPAILSITSVSKGSLQIQTRAPLVNW